MALQTHPVIRKCLQHLDVIEANDKVKQIVYMYMESLHQEMSTCKDAAPKSKDSSNIAEF